MGWAKPQIIHDISFTDWSKAIFNSIAQPFIALDRRLKVVAVNPAMVDSFQQWTGVKLFVGQNYLEALPAETIPDRMKIYRRAFAGERISVEQEYPQNDGLRTYIVTYDPLIVNGQIVGIIGSAKDITQQKLEERRSRELAGKFKNAFEYTMVGMALSGISGRFIQVNPAFCRMLGYNARELCKMTFQELTHPDDLPTNLKIADDLKSGKINWMQVEKRYRHKDGHYVWALLSCSILRDENGDHSLYVAAIQDITSRVESIKTIEEAKEHLHQQAMELARSNAELEQFAYVASHDLQEPLRMISSYLQFLDLEYRGKLSPQADEYLHFAVDGAKRMSTMIRDLLTYSRVGRANLKYETVDLNGVIQEALTNLHSLVAETGAEIIFNDLPRLSLDRYQFLRLFQNLIENSLKYRGSARLKVEIQAVDSDPQILFSVKDNGVGFDQKDATRIFDVFHRLNDRDQYTGSGIGLSIVKTIVERHGGRVWAQSEPGKGATIYFSIPKGLSGMSEKTRAK